MKRTLTLFSLLMGGCLLLMAQSTFTGNRLMWFGQQLEQLRQDLNIPGMSVLVIENDKVIWQKGFGWANLEKEILASPSTLFHLGSCTMPVTTFMLAQMEMERKISIDQSLAGFDIPVKHGTKISLRDVLSQTSTYPPRKRFQYNIHRFAYLDSVFRKINQLDFCEEVYLHFIQPFRLTQTQPTTGNPDLPSSDDSRYNHGNDLAINYAYNEDNMPVSCSMVNNCTSSEGLRSSVRDYGKFLIAQDTMLPASWQEALYTPVSSRDGKPLPMGLGWYIEEVNGHKIAWSWGGHTPGFSSLVIQDRTSGHKLILFANSDRICEPFALHTGQLLNSPVALLFFQTLVFSPEAFLNYSDFEDTAWDIIGFSTDEMNPVGGMERILLWFIFILLTTPLILWPLGFLLRKSNSVKQETVPNVFRYGPGFAIPRYVAGVAVILCFLVNWLLSKEPQLIYWPVLPGWMPDRTLFQNVLLVLPSLLVLLGFVQLLFTIWLWASRKGTPIFRIHYSLITLLVIVYLGFLNEWNLIGIGYYLNWL